MSKKKKNIRRKKSNNLLKGMAAAGAVVGGGTIFAGNNAVYAAENEQGVIGSQSEEQIIKHLLNVHQDSLIMNKHKVQMNKIL